MAMNYDSSSDAAHTGDVTWLHTPVTGTPRGVLVGITHGDDFSDLVTAVQYGGVAMTRVFSIADTSGANPDARGRSYIYKLESGIPAGPQTVTVLRGGTVVVWAAVFVFTSSGGAMEIVDSDGVQNVQNPTVTLQRAGRDCLGFVAIQSSVDAPGNFTSPSGFGRTQDHDFGDWSGACFRELAVSSADVAITVGQAAANCAMSACVIAEGAFTPPATASDFCCGAECGIVSPGVALTPNTGHIHAVGGTPPVAQTAVARHGGRAFRFSPDNALSYLERTVAAGSADRWGRMYVFFLALPTLNATLWRGTVATGDAPGVFFRVATGDIIAAVGNVFTGATAHPVTTGKWYRIEWLARVGTGTRSLAMRVCEAGPGDEFADGTAVDRGTATLAQAASSITAYRWGAACSSQPSADVVIDDLRTGITAADYPAGPSTIVGIQPTQDGTHNFNTAGDFKYEDGTNIPVAATNTWSRLIGLLNDATSYLRAAAVAAGEYLEWLTTGMPATNAILALEVVSNHKGSDLNAHKQTLRWVDGASTGDVFTDADFSETQLVRHSKHYTTPPSGGALTTAKINASKWRWGSSWTAPDVAGNPDITGLMLEVDCILSSAPPPPPSSPERNPLHTYSQPGTYTVTLRVTDDDGLQHSVSKQVTVT